MKLSEWCTTTTVSPYANETLRMVYHSVWGVYFEIHTHTHSALGGGGYTHTHTHTHTDSALGGGTHTQVV